MARPKKYSQENFLTELRTLKKKYKTLPNDSAAEAMAYYICEIGGDWNDIFSGFSAKNQELLEKDMAIDFEIPKIKKPKKKVGRPKKKL